jgi:hypothetical protein
MIQRTTVSVVDAWDAGYLKGILSDPEIFKGMFPDIVNAFIENGGRLKFNLDTLDPSFAGVTEWELRTVLSSKKLTNNTDFFQGGRQLSGAALADALRPFK